MKLRAGAGCRIFLVTGMTLAAGRALRRSIFPAIQEVQAGRLDVHYAAAARPHVEAGRLFPIATTGAERWSVFPEAPTLLELGYRSMDFYGWDGIVGPRDISADIVATLNHSANLAIADAELR